MHRVSQERWLMKKVTKRHKIDVTQPKAFYVNFSSNMSLPSPYLMEPTTK